MQIRFRSVEPLDREELRQTFAATGAEEDWLARVLPEQDEIAHPQSHDSSRRKGDG